jgi:O-antigen/teichoic acid export membrane protein
MNLLKNILRVALSNTIMLGSNIIISLILPMFISVKDYGEYRLYLFYLAYIGILHFGFIDAMYLKYGGKNENTINKRLLKKEKNTFIIYQLIITICFFIAAILFKNTFILLLSLAILPLNIGAFHKLFYQATGQFKKYSNINIIFTVINLIIICTLLLFNIKGAFPYIFSTLFAYLISLFFMEIDFYKYTKSFRPIGAVNILDYNKVGIYILIGNICVLLITSIGGWVVQLIFDIEDFAYYSFAISMMNMILLIINAIGLTFYNFIAQKEDKLFLLLVKKILLILGAIAGSAYFLLDCIIGNFLPKYALSLDLIAYSFISFPYMMVINVIITNLYKARKLERRYLKVVIMVLLAEIILDIIVLIIIKSLIGIVVVTLMTFIIWYVFSLNYEFRYLRSNLAEVLFLIIHCLIFIITVHFFNWYFGLLIYTLTIITTSGLIYFKDIRNFTISLKMK